MNDNNDDGWTLREILGYGALACISLALTIKLAVEYERQENSTPPEVNSPYPRIADIFPKRHGPRRNP